MIIRHFVHKCKGCGNIMHLEKSDSGQLMDVKGGKRYPVYSGTRPFGSTFRQSRRLIMCTATIYGTNSYGISYEYACHKEVRVSTFKEITL